jgi:hypothetical protein
VRVAQALLKAYPQWELLWILCFPLLKKGVMISLFASYKGDLGNAIPFFVYLAMNAAVFPAFVLPSAVSFWSYMLLVLMDVLDMTFGLRMVWWPVVRAWWSIEKLAAASDGVSVADTTNTTAKANLAHSRWARATHTMGAMQTAHHQMVGMADVAVEATASQVASQAALGAEAAGAAESAARDEVSASGCRLQASMDQLYGEKIVQTEMTMIYAVLNEFVEVNHLSPVSVGCLSLGYGSSLGATQPGVQRF